MIKNRESAARSRARRQVILFTLCVEWCFIFEVSLFCLIQGKIFVIGMDRLTHKNWNLKFRVWKKKMKGLGNRMYVSMPSSIWFCFSIEFWSTEHSYKIITLHQVWKSFLALLLIMHPICCWKLIHYRKFQFGHVDISLILIAMPNFFENNFFCNLPSICLVCLFH
jgi:hypothetical protein